MLQITLVARGVKGTWRVDPSRLLEMYKPAAKRRWGYFALPILYADRLVGKVDATADRHAGVLRVDAIHQDLPFDQTMTAAVQGEIKDLARWLELDLRAGSS